MKHGLNWVNIHLGLYRKVLVLPLPWKGEFAWSFTTLWVYCNAGLYAVLWWKAPETSLEHFRDL